MSLTKDKILIKVSKKLHFLIWKYGGTITSCPEPQLLLEAFQKDLEELKDLYKIK